MLLRRRLTKTCWSSVSSAVTTVCDVGSSTLMPSSSMSPSRTARESATTSSIARGDGLPRRRPPNGSMRRKTDEGHSADFPSARACPPLHRQGLHIPVRAARYLGAQVALRCRSSKEGPARREAPCRSTRPGSRAGGNAPLPPARVRPLDRAAPAPPQQTGQAIVTWVLLTRIRTNLVEIQVCKETAWRSRRWILTRPSAISLVLKYLHEEDHLPPEISEGLVLDEALAVGLIAEVRVGVARDQHVPDDLVV